MLIFKVHQTPNGKMFALCDSEILGKVFEEGEKQLNLASQFYQGEEIAEDDLKRKLGDCYIVNAVGKESVKFLENLNLVDSTKVKKINEIPYAQCVIDR